MKTKILTILRLAGTSGLPETALRMEIEMRFRITVGDMDFAHALGELVRLGYVTRSVDELTGDTRWTINECE
jgi:hypothetical protein